LFRRAFSGMILMLLLISMLALAFNFQPVKGRTMIVPDDYPTIQDAVSASVVGDTIMVRNGIYTENVEVGTSNLTIKSEKGAESTMVQAADLNANVFDISSDNVTLEGFAVSGANGNFNSAGVFLRNAHFCTISHMSAFNNSRGMILENSNANIISSNRVFENLNAIILVGSSSYNTVVGNNASFNFGDCIWGGWYGGSNNKILNNTVVSNHTIGIAVLSNNCTVSNNSVTGNGYGIWPGTDVQYVDIRDNNVSRNGSGISIGKNALDVSVIGNIIDSSYGDTGWGIKLWNSSSNITLYGNTISNNRIGVVIDNSSNTFVYHNSFVNNKNQVSCNSSDTFDDGYPAGGNYWSNYNGTDLYSGPYQNETGKDGIGDQPYVIDTNNTDRYPFMDPNGWENYLFPIETNVTVTDRTVRWKAMFFNVTGQSGQVGYVNVTMPVNFNATKIEVFVDGQIIEPPFPIITTNSTHYFVYFEVALSTHKITIHYGLVADVSGTTLGVPDGTVNMRDISYMIMLFNTRPSSPNWNPNADINNDGTVNMRDISIAILNFNKHE